MRFILIPLLALSAVATDASKMTRSLAASTVSKAHFLVRQAHQQQQRSLQDPAEDMSLEDMLGDLGEMDMSGIGALICGFMEMAEQDPAMQEAGGECSCISSETQLSLGCTTTEEMCDGQYGCISGAVVNLNMPLTMDGSAAFTMETCMTYTTDDRTPVVLQGKEFCFTAEISSDMEAIMSATSEADIAKMITCTAKLDGKECLNADGTGCEICDDGLGVKVDCGAGLTSTCTDYMGADAYANDGGTTSEASPTGGLPAGANVAVMRFDTDAVEDGSASVTSDGNTADGTTDPPPDLPPGDDEDPTEAPPPAGAPTEAPPDEPTSAASVFGGPSIAFGLGLAGAFVASLFF